MESSHIQPASPAGDSRARDSGWSAAVLDALEVRDTGVGMGARTLSHVFEPFFTTKEVGRGTGLGLSSVYGMVRQSGGFIRAESSPGEGSSFRILLPGAGDVSVTPLAGPDEARVTPAGEGKTVLLVEDESTVRRLVRRVLEREGYRVVDASHGEEALDALRDMDRPPALLLTDLIMPRMGGDELARSLRKERPDLPVLFISGYTGDEDLPDPPGEGPTSFLGKPFTPDELSRAVGELLGRASAGPA